MDGRRGASADKSNEEGYAELFRLFGLVDRWAADADRVSEVQAGSRLAEDDRLTHPYDLSHSVAVSIGSSRDHLHALRTLVVDAQALHMAAPFTLARSALENAAQALWLTSPADRETRLLRLFQVQLRDVKERHEAGRLLGEPNRCPTELKKRIERITDLAQGAGLSPAACTARSPGFGRMIREAASAAGFGGDQLQAIWSLGSGYAHGQSWPLVTAGELVRTPGQADDASVHDYQVTADVPTVVLVVGAATLVLKEAMRQNDHARLRFTTHAGHR